MLFSVSYSSIAVITKQAAPTGRPQRMRERVEYQATAGAGSGMRGKPRARIEVPDGAFKIIEEMNMDKNVEYSI
jgi:hypothetical protein